MDIQTTNGVVEIIDTVGNMRKELEVLRARDLKFKALLAAADSLGDDYISVSVLRGVVE